MGNNTIFNFVAFQSLIRDNRPIFSQIVQKLGNRSKLALIVQKLFIKRKKDQQIA